MEMDLEHEASAATEQKSQAYVGQWNRLISTTNWEKGRIIHEWRLALMQSDSPSSEYSDETWSRMVGGVTGQHVGRLRRVYERFGDVCSQYDGLYWSHFQAALDWDDAEMWLEGAVQSEWSVAAMRRQRWEAMGAIAEDEPQSEQIVVSELDEDFSNDAREAERTGGSGNLVAEDYTAEARSPAGPDFGDEDDSPPTAARSDAPDDELAHAQAERALVRPFADLAELPDDVAEAFESFQLAILRHKREQWQDVSLDDILASLDALKALALAPAD